MTRFQKTIESDNEVQMDEELELVAEMDQSSDQ